MVNIDLPSCCLLFKWFENQHAKSLWKLRMKCCKGKSLKVSLDLSGIVHGLHIIQHHPRRTPILLFIYLSFLRAIYSIIWIKISFWRWTNWHPQRRDFLSRGKLGFTYGAHYKGMLCCQVPCWITLYLCRILITLFCEQGIMYPFLHFNVQRLLILFGCYSSACLQKNTLCMFKQLFAVHLLRTRGCNYCSKALGSANTIGVGMFKKKVK